MLSKLKNNQGRSAQIFWVAIGNFVAFSFSIISAAILSRFLIKEEYGTYRQVLFVYSSLLVVFSVGLPKAYAHFLPAVEIGEGKSIANKITNVFFILGFLMSISLFLFSNQIGVLLKNESLGLALKYFSPIPFLMLPTMGIEGLYATYNKTFTIAVYTIVTRIVMLICISLPVIIFNGDHLTAVKGFLISSIITFFMAMFLKQAPFKNVDKKITNVGYSKIIQFAIPLFLSSIAGLLITSADQFFISRYFGTKTFAEFSNGAMQLPFVTMITGAVATVLQPYYTRLNAEGSIQQEFLGIWKASIDKSTILIYPMVTFFLFFAYPIMEILYGKEYTNSGMYFQIMASINYLGVIIYLPIILALSEIRYYNNVHWVAAILIWILDFVLLKFISDPLVVCYVSILTKVFVIGCMLFKVASRFNVKVVNLLPIIQLFKILVICIVAVLITKWILSFITISTLLLLIIGLVIYIGLVLLIGLGMKVNFLRSFKTILANK